MAGNSIIGALRVVLGLDKSELTTGLKEAGGEVGNFGKLALTGFGAIAAGAAAMGAAVAAGTKHAIDAADDMSKAAQKFGVPIEQLSRLKHAADLSDVSLDDLGVGLKQLSKKMADAAAGGKSAKVFEQLGVSVTDASGHLRDTNDVLEDVAGKFAGMQDGAAKTALSMQVFGKSGADLIPMLNSGKEGLHDMAAEADALGLTIDQKTGTAAENFNDNLTRLGLVFGGITTRIAAALAPTLAKLTDMLVGLITKTDFMNKVSKALDLTFKGLATAALVLGAAFKTQLTIAGTIAEAFGKVLRGDFAGAWQAVSKGWNTGVADFKGAAASIKTIWEDTGAEIAKGAEKTGDDVASPVVKAVAKVKAAKAELEKLLGPEKLDLDKSNAHEGSADPIRVRVLPQIDPQVWSEEIGKLDADIRLSNEAQIRMGEDIADAFTDGFMAALNGDLMDFLKSTLSQVLGQIVNKAFKDAIKVGADGKISLGGFKLGNLSTTGSVLASGAMIAGNAIGGRAGGALSGAGMGATIGSIIPGVGTAIGAVVGGLLGGIFGGGAKKKARQEAERQAAEAAAQKAAQVAATKRELEIQLMEQTGDTAGALAARRSDELDALRALDPSLVELQQKLYDAQDAADAAAKSAEAQAKAEADLQKARDDAQTAIDKAKDDAAAAFSAEADRLTSLRDEYRGFGDELTDLAHSLAMATTTGAGSYAAIGKAFDDIARRAALGDKDALSGFKQAVTDLQTASERDGTAFERARDQVKIRLATEKAAATANRQADIAQEQLDANLAQVTALGLVKDAVLTIPQALQNLGIAMANASATAAGGSGQALGANPGVNAILAAQTGYTGAFGSGGFQNFITNADAATQATARNILTAFGQMDRIQGFATGGAFEIGGPAGIDKARIALNATPGEIGIITKTDPLAGMSGIAAQLQAAREQDANLMTQLIVKVDQLANDFRIVSNKGQWLRVKDVA